MKKSYILHKVRYFSFSLILLTSFVFAQDIPNIQQALDYLKTYKFGMNREPLEPILEAIKTTKNDPQKQEQLSKQLVAILPQCSIDGKRFITRQLTVIGTPSIIPQIEPLLTDKETIDLGCRILEQIPGREATEALIRALDKGSEDDKIAIINSLGRRQDTLAITPLAKYLDNAPQKIQSATILALSAIGGKEAGNILWNWAKSKAVIENPEVQSALLKIANGLTKENAEKDLTVEICSSLFHNEKVSPINKSYALETLVQVKGKEAFDEVWQSVQSENAILSSTGLDLLKNPSFPDDLILEKCLPVLKSGSPRIQLGLLEVIASRKIEGAVPYVLDLAQNSKDEVKLSAIQCLGSIGNKDVIEPMINMALNEAREIKDMAKDALVKLDNPDVNPYLIQKAQQGKSEEKKLAIELLTERRALEAKGVMRDIVAKKDPDTFDGALNYLAVLGDEADLSFLFDTCLSDAENSSAYIPSLSLMLDRVGDEGRKIMLIMDRWKTCKNDLQKRSLISLLGNLKSTEACGTLIELLSNEPNLKTTILQSMGQCEDEDTLQKIVNVVENESAEDIRNAGALSALNILRTLKLPDKQKYEYYVKLWKYAGANPSLQKNILGGIAKLSLLEAFDFMEGLKVSDTVKADWANARFNIARNIGFSYPSKALPVLEEMLPNLKDNQAKETDRLINGIKNKGEYLCSWSISGPYRIEDYSAKRLFDEVSFPPEKDISSVRDWRILPMKVREDGLIYADLAEWSGGEVECVAYVACKLKVSEPTGAQILLGSNDGVKVWLNGTLVHSFPEGRTMTPDQDQFSIQLQKENILLLAIYNQGAAWEFTVKIHGISADKIIVEPYIP